jgi:RimJ/RimL family protein N-acetyltransferase
LALPEIIPTPRLRLEPFSERHLTERYVGWLNDAELMRFSENRHARHTLDSCRAYWRSFDTEPHLFWAIVAKDASLGHVGNATAHVEERHGRADLGILIGERAARGKGFASEAWLGLCDHLFRSRGLRKLTAGAVAPHAAMLRVMQKAGMLEDGRRTAHSLWQGQPVDVVHYALFREEWLARHPSPPATT